MSGDYKLQALLELREHALAEAERVLSLAAADVSKSQANQHGLDAAVEQLREKLRHQRQEVGMVTRTAAHLQAQARFENRLQTELTDAERKAQAHRIGALAQAER